MTLHKNDLESKLREIQSVVVDTEDQVRRRSRTVMIGIAAVVVGLVVYRIWQGRRQRIRIEVYRQS